MAPAGAIPTGNITLAPSRAPAAALPLHPQQQCCPCACAYAWHRAPLVSAANSFPLGAHLAVRSTAPRRLAIAAAASTLAPVGPQQAGPKSSVGGQGDNELIVISAEDVMSLENVKRRKLERLERLLRGLAAPPPATAAATPATHRLRKLHADLGTGPGQASANCIVPTHGSPDALSTTLPEPRQQQGGSRRLASSRHRFPLAGRRLAQTAMPPGRQAEQSHSAPFSSPGSSMSAREALISHGVGNSSAVRGSEAAQLRPASSPPRLGPSSLHAQSAVQARKGTPMQAPAAASPGVHRPPPAREPQGPQHGIGIHRSQSPPQRLPPWASASSAATVGPSGLHLLATQQARAAALGRRMPLHTGADASTGAQDSKPPLQAGADATAEAVAALERALNAPAPPATGHAAGAAAPAAPASGMAGEAGAGAVAPLPASAVRATSTRKLKPWEQPRRDFPSALSFLRPRSTPRREGKERRSGQPARGEEATSARGEGTGVASAAENLHVVNSSVRSNSEAAENAAPQDSAPAECRTEPAVAARAVSIEPQVASSLAAMPLEPPLSLHSPPAELQAPPSALRVPDPSPDAPASTEPAHGVQLPALPPLTECGTDPVFKTEAEQPSRSAVSLAEEMVPVAPAEIAPAALDPEQAAATAATASGDDLAVKARQASPQLEQVEAAATEQQFESAGTEATGHAVIGPQPAASLGTMGQEGLVGTELQASAGPTSNAAVPTEVVRPLHDAPGVQAQEQRPRPKPRSAAAERGVPALPDVGVPQSRLSSQVALKERPVRPAAPPAAAETAAAAVPAMPSASPALAQKVLAGAATVTPEDGKAALSPANAQPAALGAMAPAVSTAATGLPAPCHVSAPDAGVGPATPPPVPDISPLLTMTSHPPDCRPFPGSIILREAEVSGTAVRPAASAVQAIDAPLHSPPPPLPVQRLPVGPPHPLLPAGPDARAGFRAPRRRSQGGGGGLLSSRDLTSALSNAPSWVDVAQLVHTWHAELNAISLAAAFKRLAKCCQPQMLDSSRPEGAKLLSMLQHLCFQLEQHMPAMGPRELSGVLWSLASLGFFPPGPLAAALVGSFMAALPAANAIDCAQAVWALGQLGWPAERAQLEAVWRRTMACLQPDRPSSRSLLVVLCSATKMGLRLPPQERLWLESQLVAAAPMLSSQDVANALSSLTRLSQPGAAWPAQEEGALELQPAQQRGPSAGAEQGEAAQPQLGMRPQPATMHALLWRMSQLLHTMRGDEAIMVLYSLARLRFLLTQTLRTALLSRCAAQRCTTSPGALSLGLWAVSQLGRRPPGWWTSAVLEQSLRRLAEMQPSNVATLLYGLAQVRCAPEPEVAAAVLHAVAERMPDFSAREVANVAWALGQLPPDCVPTRGSPLWLAIGSRCQEVGFMAFTPQGLANLLWGLAAVAPKLPYVRHRPMPPLPKLRRPAAAEEPSEVDAVPLVPRNGAAAATGMWAKPTATAATTLVSPATATAGKVEDTEGGARPILQPEARAPIEPRAPAGAATAGPKAEAKPLALSTTPETPGAASPAQPGEQQPPASTQPWPVARHTLPFLNLTGLRAALDAKLPLMNATELSMTVWSLARLRLNPGRARLDAVLARAARLLRQMSLEGLVALVHAVTWIPSYCPEEKAIDAFEDEVLLRFASIRSAATRRGLHSRLSCMRAILRRRRAMAANEDWKYQLQCRAAEAREQRKQRHREVKLRLIAEQMRRMEVQEARKRRAAEAQQRRARLSEERERRAAAAKERRRLRMAQGRVLAMLQEMNQQQGQGQEQQLRAKAAAAQGQEEGKPVQRRFHESRQQHEGRRGDATAAAVAAAGGQSCAAAAPAAPAATCKAVRRLHAKAEGHARALPSTAARV